MTDLDDLVRDFDVSADRMRDALRRAQWTEAGESPERWRAPEGKRVYGLAAAWERARLDAVDAWRAEDARPRRAVEELAALVVDVGGERRS